MDSPHVPSRDWSSVEAVLLDLDGVVTRTATIHAASWKTVLDPVLERAATARGVPYRPWDADAEYRAYVDGKPREVGARAALAARGVVLPEGGPDDGPEVDTIAAIARRKQQALLALLATGQIPVDAAALPLVNRWHSEGRRVAIVTSSRNGRRILAAAGLEELFDVIFDGNDALARSLTGKPSPDTFLAAARELAVSPSHAAVVEDSLAGVQAARRGRFRAVVGVARTPQEVSALRHGGATLVVSGLAELASVTLPATHAAPSDTAPAEGAASAPSGREAYPRATGGGESEEGMDGPRTDGRP